MYFSEKAKKEYVIVVKQALLVSCKLE